MSISRSIQLPLLLMALVLMTSHAWLSASPVRHNAMLTRLAMADIQKGTVKWFDSTKGFGFIAPDNEDPDVFVHQTSIQTEGYRSLAQGEAVEFQLHEENGRTKAIHVTGPDGADVQGAPFAPRLDFKSYME